MNNKYIKHFRFIFIICIFIISIIYSFSFTKPDIILDKDSIDVKVFSNYDGIKYKAYLYDKDITDKIKISGSVDTNKVGTYAITYSYNNLFNVGKKVLKVNVIDDVKPVITLDGDTTIKMCPHAEYKEIGYHANDNYDGDITDKVTSSILDDKVTYEVSDSSGNKTSSERILNRVDDSVPNIVLKGDSVVNINVNSNYTDEGAVALDDCDGDISDKISVESDVDTSKVGTYTVTYKISDESNNTNSVTRTVNVLDNCTDTNTNNNNESGVIYLTFDDGPGIYTNDILDILKKYNIKATFFVTGLGSDSTIKREYLEGHTIGLHTYTHKWNIYSSVDSYFDDLNKIQDRVYKITGEKSKYIRFPGGSSNTISKNYSVGIMSTLTSEVEKRGYEYFDWNVEVGDADVCARSSVSDKEACVLNNFKKGLYKNGSNVVLLHDIKEYTKNSLENMIKYALSNNYKFKKIDDNTKTMHHHVNN